MKANKVILNGETVIDLTADTVTAETLAVGVTAHDKSGNQIVGTFVGGGGEKLTLFTPSISLQSVTSVLTITDDNGGFVQGYNLYANDNLITVLTSKEVTLTDYIEHTETIDIKVQAFCANFNSSDYAVTTWKYVNVAGTPGLAYTINGSYATCTGIGEAVATDIEIALVYEGCEVTHILNGVFENNKTITSVTIPTSVTAISDLAFRECNGLVSVTVEGNVTYIGNQAFNWCNSLRKLDLSNCTAVPTLSNTNAFKYADRVQIKVPANLIDSWKTATNWSDYASKIVTEFTN